MTISSTTDSHDEDFRPSIADAIGVIAEVGQRFVELKERQERSARSWALMRRTALATFVIAGLGAAAFRPGIFSGVDTMPHGQSIAVLSMTGPIGGENASNADTLVPVIRSMCENEAVSGLVIRISSPGGSPTDAERIGSSLSSCGRQKKRVVAVIEGMGASAAYMVALNADSIWVNRYGTVGSIGAVMRSLNVADLAGRAGVSERVIASGELKGGNGLWTPNTEGQTAHYQTLVDGVAGLFEAEVRARRGDRLKVTADMWSGRTWLAGEAKALGLVDEVGVFEDAILSEFGDVPTYEVVLDEPSAAPFDLEGLTKRIGAHVVAELTAERIE
jgi:protease-4